MSAQCGDGRAEPALAAAPVRSPRVRLDPLRAGDAPELAPLLGDATIYQFIGGVPLGLAELQTLFAGRERGRSPDGREAWLNWVVRRGGDDAAVGTVQATVRPGVDGPVAELAWVIGTAYQGQGIAKDAAALMARWLSEHGIVRLQAHIHPEHGASAAVARSLGLVPTDAFLDGERRWESGRCGHPSSCGSAAAV